MDFIVSTGYGRIVIPFAGKVKDFLMNDKCAAGAGRSMGIVAELLKVPLAEIGPLSLEAKEPVPISSTCVVFARSEILAYLRQGVPKPDILAGACEALVSRVSGMLRWVGLEDQFVITGGIAKNLGVVRRLEENLGIEAHIGFEPQIVGALGAAIFGQEILAKRATKRRRGGGASEESERA